MAKAPKYLTITEVAKRCDVAASALRFYETRGLISSTRTAGNQRRYHSSMIRRIAVIKVAQNLGLTLEEIGEAFRSLPDSRTPTKRDWERLSRQWGDILDDKINQMQNLRHNLSGCIGCGCLSLKRCSLTNPNDNVSDRGPGARYLIE
ncbi:redox-sensitive transcriptional activator SoxR [uncultured Endozoicomonas sp.]|uniref:redox-sensitive transcriptional activator SoxR n=1 Tax=uncultured Endozoicomonas sp. TaxID=432652 RepID=UPI002625E45A|nr:redox-sensitive transcriptional activator SoxR [uncultured Endozoicomonas sp.]